MQELSSGDLLTMASIDRSDPECISAFEEFHKRYKNFVWKIAYIKARSIDNSNAIQVAMVLSQNTFIKIYEKADVFVPQSSDINKDCMKWISGIMKNITLQYLQENNKQKEHVVFMEVLPEVVTSDEEDLPVLISYEKDLLQNALKTLSDKEKSILLSWYNFYSEGKVRNISKDIKEALAMQFNVRVDSLKKIKERALKKVKAYIEKHQK